MRKIFIATWIVCACFILVRERVIFGQEERQPDVQTQQVVDVEPVTIDYVGALTCSSCHREIYNSWLQTGHAKSMKEIKTSTQNQRCCLLYTSPSPRDATLSRMPSSA